MLTTPADHPMRPTSRKDDDFVEFICDQLTQLDAAMYRPMFGGYGLYEGVVFFGIVYDGRLYFKTDDTTRPQYEEWGSVPFQPSSKQTLRNYFEVPLEIIEDAERLNVLAQAAVRVAAGG
jgi:DNA transformation protein